MKRGFQLICSIAAFVFPISVWAQIAVVGSLSNDREVTPGMTYEGKIRVHNETNEMQEAKVYQSDYLFFHDGRTQLDKPGTLPRSNANWIQYTPSRLLIPPKETIEVEYVVQVPERHRNTVPAGTFWSILFVEPIPIGSAESSLGELEQDQLGVRQIIRYGIQVASHVMGPAQAEVTFEGITTIEGKDGIPFLHINIANHGERMMRPEMYVEFYDEAGIMQQRSDGGKYRIYPGTSVRQRIDLSDLPSGTYEALIVVDAGGDNIFGTQYTLSI